MQTFHEEQELTLPFRIESDPKRRVYVRPPVRRRSRLDKLEQVAEITASGVSAGCCLAMIYLVARIGGLIG